MWWLVVQNWKTSLPLDQAVDLVKSCFVAAGERDIYTVMLCSSLGGALPFLVSAMHVPGSSVRAVSASVVRCWECAASSDPVFAVSCPGTVSPVLSGAHRTERLSLSVRSRRRAWVYAREGGCGDPLGKEGGLK